MHVCMMHTSIILDPDTFVYDACIYDAANLSFDPDTYIYLMHVWTMHIHMLLDHDAYVHDAYICDIQSLTMLHVSMMRQISSFVYDANPGGSPGRDGAVGLEQAYYEVGMCLMHTSLILKHACMYDS